MNTLKKSAVFLALLLALAACGQRPADTTGSPAAGTAGSPGIAALPAADSAALAAGDPAADEAAIRSSGASRDHAYTVRNSALLVALYAEDAVLMPPTAPVAKDRAAIRGYLEADMAQLSRAGYTLDVPADAVKITVSGNLGLRSGTYFITDKSGAKMDTGKWLEAWRKTDAGWQIIMDIWNSDTLPLMMPESDEEGGTAEP